MFRLLIAGLLSVMALQAKAQSVPPAAANPPSARIAPVTGRYITEIDGEQVLLIELAEVPCYPPPKFKNRRDEEFYWRTVRDVRKALPYAKLICETLTETYEYIETLPESERQDHLKRMESEVFEQYKPVLRTFTRGQATVLCKLIKRETNQTGYNILKAFLGSFRAGFWQTFGRFFGVNLRTDFKPNTDPKDATIERVASLIEVGAL